MLGNFVIDFLVAALLLAGWYFWFARANRRRSVRILRWIEAAFYGQGRIASVCWHGASRFEVGLRLSSSVFRRASLSVQMQPREMPVNWLMARLRKHKETVTFEAELLQPPDFSIDLQNHRWVGRTRSVRPKSLDGRKFSSLGPVMISTREDWQRELGHLPEALLSARSCDFLRVNFRRRAPHFLACAPLQSLCPDAPGSAMFDVLQELASSASRSAR